LDTVLVVFVFIVCTKCTVSNADIIFTSGAVLIPLQHKHQDNGHEHCVDTTCAAGESLADGYKRRNKRKARELSDDEDEVQIRTAADPALVNEIKSRLKALGKMQREVARDIGVSEGILSQYMNGATRSNGWRSIETNLTEWLEASAAMTPVTSSVNANDSNNNNSQSSDSASGPRLKRRKLAGSSDAAHDDHSGASSPTREVGAVAPRRITPIDPNSAAFNLSQLTVVMPTSQPMTINSNNSHWLNQAQHMPEHMSPVTSSEEQVSSSYELHELQFYNPQYNYEYLSPSALDLYVELTDDNVKQIVAESSYYNNNNSVPAQNDWASPFAV
jgi:transcriptional regulator with XRE-family HTH domain